MVWKTLREKNMQHRGNKNQLKRGEGAVARKARLIIVQNYHGTRKNRNYSCFI